MEFVVNTVYNVFSAHAEVVPLMGPRINTPRSILRARGGSS